MSVRDVESESYFPETDSLARVVKLLFTGHVNLIAAVRGVGELLRFKTYHRSILLVMRYYREVCVPFAVGVRPRW